MKRLSNRKSILREILILDNKIKKKRRDPKYVWIKHNILSIESSRFGSQLISIASPKDPDIILQVKNNSQQMKHILLCYKEMLTEFDNGVKELLVHKKKLQKHLFARPT
ncbi:hypothetical protein CL673_09670 [Candidatus Bathyarchaeota archaeon]|jgi:hypothetical protein|nr:hypothetical protein [Candidatus Bathyarchaeota archaeon]|tara:strand:+ start:1597 stop:1923 length:327 start_codon:yes stop_codon:yes gene_type:complete